MKTIITAAEAKRLGRPIGKVADEKINAFITEVENTIIRKSIGDALYMKIVSEEEHDADITMLLDGGVYTDKCGSQHMVTGLKVAEAYYVYAQNVRAGDFESTRYGMVIKDDSYSNGLSSKERDQAANSATEVADAYLRECMEYCRIKGIIKGSTGGNLHPTSGCVIRKVRV